MKGFSVENEQKAHIGFVQSFQSHSLQDLLLVKGQAKAVEIPIPFVKSYILRIDFKAKKLLSISQKIF